ncbi:hypothetical protein Tco_1268016 [Tanacetum coccineum]
MISMMLRLVFPPWRGVTLHHFPSTGFNPMYAGFAICKVRDAARALDDTSSEENEVLFGMDDSEENDDDDELEL